MTALRWQWLGRVPYRPVWDRMESLRAAVTAGAPSAERLLLCEHQPVVTLGRSADARNLRIPAGALLARGIEVCRTNRGGDVTYHGPGQLVVYPVVRLRRGVVHHVESIGRALVAVLADLGVEAEWRRDPLGVWVGAAKVAACGVHVRRGVAIHGYALNVTDEVLDGFGCIVPCGLSGVGVTTIARELGSTPPDVRELAERVAVRIALMWDRKPLYSCDPS